MNPSGLIRALDFWAATWPTAAPTRAQTLAAEVVAHRGAPLARATSTDAPAILENTLAAFDRADAAGAWGIEFDVRYDGDRRPVVCHDPDLVRVFGVPGEIDRPSTAELRRRAPAVPSLHEVVERYGGRRHLMIELKVDALPVAGPRGSSFADALRAIEPGRDWHVLALHPDVFDRASWVPPEARLLVSTAFPGGYSRLSLKRGWAGIAGHFALVTAPIRRAHHEHRQKVGVGQIASARCLRREVSRGADWLFTDDAVGAQGWLDAERRAACEA